MDLKLLWKHMKKAWNDYTYQMDYVTKVIPKYTEKIANYAITPKSQFNKIYSEVLFLRDMLIDPAPWNSGDTEHRSYILTKIKFAEEYLDRISKEAYEKGEVCYKIAARELQWAKLKEKLNINV